MPDIPGGPEGQSPGFQRLDAPRDLSLSLSPDGTSISITLSFIDLPGVDYGEPTTVTTYYVWWLDPAVFSDNFVSNIIPIQVGNIVINTLPYEQVVAARKAVFSTSGTWTTPTLTYSTSYVPYTTGGWMYATSKVGSEQELETAGTNFVRVPKFNPSTSAALDYPTNVNAVQLGNVGTNGKVVAFGWTNPITSASNVTMKYVQIWLKNYLNDTNITRGNGYITAGPVFPCNAGPGSRQGIAATATSAGLSNITLYESSVVLLRDTPLVGPHSVTCYFVPMSDGYVIKNPNDPTSGAPSVTFAGGIT